jgi:DNA-directed RNA polymerase specialized sigma24 family protein
VSALVESQASNERLVDLMVGYQRGSLSSFEQLYSSLAAPILRLLSEAVDHPRRAEEMLHETFLQIHVHRHTYRAPRSVERWARDVASYVLRRRGIRTE